MRGFEVCCWNKSIAVDDARADWISQVFAVDLYELTLEMIGDLVILGDAIDNSETRIDG